MKRINIFLITLFLTISPLVAQAHGDGGHSAPALTQSEATEFAINRVVMLVNNGKIDKSWEPVKAASAEQRANGYRTEWVVTFKNSNVSEEAKSTLYIFLSVQGEFIAANFTGK